MGSYTYGSLWVQFNRVLTENEVARWLTWFKELPDESSVELLGDAWAIAGTTMGDIGIVDLDAKGLNVEAGGKVYEIPQAVQVFIDNLPGDVSCSGEGYFETDSEHWALRVKGRKVEELEAVVVIREDYERPAAIPVESPALREAAELLVALKRSEVAAWGDPTEVSEEGSAVNQLAAALGQKLVYVTEEDVRMCTVHDSPLFDVNTHPWRCDALEERIAAGDRGPLGVCHFAEPGE